MSAAIPASLPSMEASSWQKLLAPPWPIAPINSLGTSDSASFDSNHVHL